MEATTKEHVYKTPSYVRKATLDYYNRNRSNPEFMEKMKARSKVRYAKMKKDKEEKKLKSTE